MKTSLLLLSALVALSAAASADILKPGGVGSECRALAAYVPDAKNSAEYKPGVDAQGRPVVEADITPNVITLPDTITFDLTVDTAKYMGLAVPRGLEGQMKVGTITIEKGQTYFNGKPLGGEAEAALKKLCTEKKKK